MAKKTLGTGTTISDVGDSLNSWAGDLAEYSIPKTDLGTTTATSMVQDPLAANIAAAPSLEKIANIISGINQQSWLSAPGRQQELGNIQRWQAGELDPSVYSGVASQAAQTYGGGGFGVDSPAWQAAVQRALGTSRQALQEKGAAALGEFYQGMPTTDVAKYTMTPQDFASVQDAARARQLQLAELQQKGALTRAELTQRQALANQELAFKQQQLAQERDLAKAAAYANLYGQLYTGFEKGGGGFTTPVVPQVGGTVAGGYRANVPDFYNQIARARSEQEAAALQRAQAAAQMATQGFSQLYGTI